MTGNQGGTEYPTCKIEEEG